MRHDYRRRPKSQYATRTKYLPGARVGPLGLEMLEKPMRIGPGTKRIAKFRCGCGLVFFAEPQNVASGNTKSCGCRKPGPARGWKLKLYEAEHGTS